jgi:hypothetical protein
VVKPIFFSSNYHPCLVTLGMIYDDLWPLYGICHWNDIRMSCMSCQAPM